MSRIITSPLPDGSFAQVSIPDFAIPIPPSGLVPGVQAATVQSIKDEYVREDQAAVNIFDGACNSYILNAGRMRDLGMSQDKWPIKPTQPLSHLVMTAADQPGTVWVWLEDGPAMGEPCRDLAKVVPAQPTPGTVQIGKHNYGMWWAQGPMDNPPDDIVNGRVFQGTSMDGVTGSWMFVASPLSSAIYGHKGWYCRS